MKVEFEPVVLSLGKRTRAMLGELAERLGCNVTAAVAVSIHAMHAVYFVEAERLGDVGDAEMKRQQEDWRRRKGALAIELHLGGMELSEAGARAVAEIGPMPERK